MEKSIQLAKKSSSISRRNADDGLLRVFRLAIATTGEFSTFFINRAGVSTGTIQQRKAAVIAGLNEIMTRVNAIYERELGTTLELIANNDAIVFLNAATDGLTHGNVGIANREAQPIIDNIIGDNNYDVGHLVDTEGTGRASLNVVCVSGQKALGGTGADPESLYFFVTIVHELGHQFGALHSFNNSCGGNRLEEGAVEPGSGSTIMSYATSSCAPRIDNGIQYYHSPLRLKLMLSLLLSASFNQSNFYSS